MEITDLADGQVLRWRCTDGHKNWQDNTFDFELVAIDDGRTRLRFTQIYATELSDDDYGVYNFNWAYYLEASGCCARQAPARRTRRPRDAPIRLLAMNRTIIAA